MKNIVRKIVTLIITLLCISFLSFAAFSVIPGDAALSKLGKDATIEQIEALREEMGFNDPLPARYSKWLSSAMQGDFGESYRYTGTSVNPARSIAPAIFQGGTALENLWIFIIGPFVGGACAAGIWKLIEPSEK